MRRHLTGGTLIGVLCATALATALAAALAAQQQPRLSPRDVDRLPSKPADTKIPYGDDSQQFGELRLPSGNGPFPVAIVIHGGCWVSTFATLQNTAALSDALRDAGIATWNLEYRRLDQPGGGWPGTFTDIAAGVDRLADVAKSHPLDLSRVAVVGHSAGAHLALWAAARAKLPASSAIASKSPLKMRAAVALGGPGDLRNFTQHAQRVCGTPVIERLLGGSPESVPERYAHGSPIELLPFGVRQLLIVGENDGVMPEAARNAYVDAARKAGDVAEVIVVPGGHFEVIAPVSAAWPTVRDKILELVRRRQ